MKLTQIHFNVKSAHIVQPKTKNIVGFNLCRHKKYCCIMKLQTSHIQLKLYISLQVRNEVNTNAF